MAAVHREVETTYAADDAFELPPLTELVAEIDRAVLPDGAATVVAEGEETQHLQATYFDTADLRLAEGGLTLRRRTGGNDEGWHLKVPAGAGARSEVRLPLGRATRKAPPELKQMVWARSRGASLRPVAEVATQRTVRRLVDATGQVLVEIADDRVTARRLLPLDGLGDAAGAPMSWREIEVELGDGREQLMDALDSRLRARGLQVAPSASKLAHVLGDTRGNGRRPKPGKKLTATSSAGQVVLAHLTEQVEQVTQQDLPVRLDAPDAVHKMRVATRRLRSALTTFKPLFDPAVARPLRDELRWLAGELGAARDAEVMRDRVRKAVESQGEDMAPGSAADAAAAELEQTYRDAHDRVLAELDGDRYHRILKALDRLISSPPLTKKAARPAGKALPRLVGRSYTDVRRIVEQADATPEGAEREELLHDARKAAKRSRYAGESVSRVFGTDALAFAEAMEGVQEALGEHQDSVLTRERLRELALHTSSTAAAFLYGRLHALEESRAQEMEQHFTDAWKAAGRRSLHRWLRTT